MPKKVIWLVTVCITLLALLSASCNETSTTSEPVMRYQSTEHGFSIEYPEGWAENVQGAGTQFSIEFTGSEGRLSASVYLEYECQEIVSADFIAQGEAYLSSVPGYELISERNISVSGGISGHEVLAKGDLGIGQVEKFRFVLLVRGQQGFWYGVHGEPAEFDDQEEIVEAIIDSFKLLSTYTFTVPEPWPGGAYTGAGFTITIPAEWCQYPPARPSHVLHYAAPERSLSVYISLEHGPEDTTLDDYVDIALESFPDYWASFSLISRREVTLGGTPAYEIVFTGMSDLSPGYTLKCKYLVVLDEAQAFWVMAATDPTLFAQHEPVINQVIYSFRLR